MDRLTSDPLARLAERCGIEPGYRDVRGTWRATSDETRRALLRAMGFDVPDAAAARTALAALEAEAAHDPVAPVHVIRRAEAAAGVPCRPRAGGTAAWRIVEEWGREHGGTVQNQRVPVPEAIAEGYHRLELEVPGAACASSALLVVPDRCYLPPALAQGGRLWGAAAQLYGLRSRRNAGIGDFTDLETLLTLWARHGAALLGVNPLHALPGGSAASPYSPSSRRFLDPQYIDVTAVADAVALGAAERAALARFEAEASTLRAAPLVDYAGVRTAKLRALGQLHAAFRRGVEGAGCPRELEAFCRRHGEALRRHALHGALAERFGADWRTWPAGLRAPATAAVRSFEREARERVAFHKFLQWQADAQLGRVAARAQALGMPIGLYADLAVSIGRDGADAWAEQALYAREASIGAPPDEFAPDGQDWGLPPPIPAVLRRQAYAPLAAILRANMAHAGALRIDHAMGLARLFWIPSGAPPADGAYVRYPLEDLLGVVALESQRNRCLVIGEDLGTVPADFFDRLQQADLLSYRLLLFERTAARGFRSPSSYPQKALAAWATHDLPTFRGWWRTAPAAERDALVDVLKTEGVLRAAPDRPSSRTLAPAVHAYVARTRAALALVQMEDVLGVSAQANVPNDPGRAANWRSKLPAELDALEVDAALRRHARAMAGERSGVATPDGASPRRRRGTAAAVPRATYRLQLHRDFTLRDATRLVPYLAALGVSHVYCSPYLKARPGSTHGYDIVDHDALNPEIGAPAELDAFVEALRIHGMGQILDVVPNHMGVMGADNEWWMDVLENGPASPSAEFFDIDWGPRGSQAPGRLVLPLLADRYGRELAAGTLELRFEPERGSFAVWYHEHRLPIDPASYPVVLARAAAALGAAAPAARLTELAAAFAALPGRHEVALDAIAKRALRKARLQTGLARLAAGDPVTRDALEAAAHGFNGVAGDAASFDALHTLLEAQAWRPAWWRVAADEINYRRFFEVSDLAALRMENERVFEATHRFVTELVRSGRVQGLRIDHPDGLNDPRRYFERLQQACAMPHAADASPDAARPIYVVAEKILASFEQLPADWAVHGTTGYDFGQLVNGLFVEPAARGSLTRLHRAFTGEWRPFAEIAAEAKRLVLRTALAGELDSLARAASRIAETDRDTRDYTTGALRQALTEVIVAFPVYRTYVHDAPTVADRRYIGWAVRQARASGRAVQDDIFDFVERLLLGEAFGLDDPRRGAVLSFARRFQQLSAPVMAKGSEDTALYRYTRLLSLNEVGGDPDEFGIPVRHFHRANARRARDWPHDLIATSTHDSKRSEDVRARLDVISEMPEAWRAAVRRWSRANRRHRRTEDEASAPSRNDEYLLYQTLLGSFPSGAVDGDTLAAYRGRITAYLTKALREAKTRTAWTNVDEAYEAATLTFAARLLDDAGDNAFLPDFRAFLAPVAWLGTLNSLSMTVLKLVSPGVPDIYQGNELLDFSLVDPDNRRPVDYERRRTLLARISRLDVISSADRGLLAAHAQDGWLKLFAIHRLLGLRRAHAAFFRDAGYRALAVRGTAAHHVVAFARRHGGRTLVCAVPRLMAGLVAGPGSLPCGEAWPADTDLVLPARAAAQAFRDALSGRVREAEDGRLPVRELFADLPAAVLVSG